MGGIIRMYEGKLSSTVPGEKRKSNPPDLPEK
jgi:hypothetical protein